MRWAVGLVLAGCYGPTPITGAPCASPSAAERCPSGQVCVASGGEERCQLAAPSDAANDAPGDAPVDACTSCTPTDPDGDGIPTAADNCPMAANPLQANEDGDALGDVCDPCPPSATGNADSDGDGVGDACDPSVEAEHIAQFVGFGSGLPAGWTPVGTFTAINGDGVAVAGAAQGALLVMPAPATGFVAISAEVTFDAFVGNNLAGVGVVDRRRGGTDDSVNCQLVGDATGGSQLLRLYDSANGVFVSEVAHPLAVGTTAVLRITRELNGSHRCSATLPSVTTMGTAAFDPASPELGVRVRSGTARYHWIMVVTRP